MNASPTPSPAGRQTPAPTLLARYDLVRAWTRRLRAPLSVEDCGLQAMPDASPVKWHLAHTTWFFETFVLGFARRDLPAVNAIYRTLFNSYYEAVGPRHTRAERGLLSRPSLAEVEDYRAIVDERMHALLAEGPDEETQRRIEIGLHHEQQHQELLLTDVLAALSRNPLAPVYRAPHPDDDEPDCPATSASPLAFVEGPEGVVRVGHAGTGFAFDNEGPSHRVFLERFAIGDRPLTNREALAFVEAGGYADPRLWLSEGFDFVRREGIDAPLYWRRHPEDSARFQRFTLRGVRDLERDLDAPVSHLSYYEADALARFVSGRLPTEHEWEAVAGVCENAARGEIAGNFAEAERFVPSAATPELRGAPRQLFGDVWEWTSSAYAPYPGYRAEDGALGEYNGKFMVGQQVLRGGSCLSPHSHLRASYRNFFPASARWQMSGVRVARSLP